MSKALELADKQGKWTSADCMDAAAELRRLAAIEQELDRIKALEPVAWMVYAGLLNMLPIYPAYNTKSTAEFAASQIKSVTAVRPLFDLTQPKETT